MNVVAHFQSLAAEFAALKDRVYNIIQGAHWQTHGEWRESILRTVLRRHLPDSVGVGRGFITDGSERSTQIDVLLYNKTAPLLYRDHDLVIVTPDAVLGIIEVKSTVRSGDLLAAVEGLVSNGQLAAPRKNQAYRPAPLLALFSYELHLRAVSDATWVLAELADAARSTGQTVSQICLDTSHFVHYWPCEPGKWAGHGYNQWHLYRLEDLAIGYFVHNIVQHIAGESVDQNMDVWFPPGDKERYLIKARPFPEEGPWNDAGFTKRSGLDALDDE